MSTVAGVIAGNFQLPPADSYKIPGPAAIAAGASLIDAWLHHLLP
jgi:hypothetical protein